MKQQVINLIKKVLNQTGLEGNQLTEKEWERSIEEAKIGDQEIIFHCQETLIDILNTAFRQDKLRVPRKLVYHLRVWRNCQSVPELINKTIKSSQDLSELENLTNSLLIKQKVIVFISNIIDKNIGANSSLIYGDTLWMNWWQDEITNEQDNKKIINHCQETLKERVFKTVLDRNQLYNSHQLERNINQRIQTAQNFSHLESLVEELIKEILKEKKRDYIEQKETLPMFRYSLNEEEKELINKTLDFDDLVENVVPRIKEQQSEEERVRKEVINNLQVEFDRLELTEKDLDKSYVETKMDGKFFSLPFYIGFADDKPKKHIVFEEKINSRLDDDLKTIEEVKTFEQEAKKHLWEKARTKIELKLKQHQEVSQKVINQLKEENKQLQSQIQQTETKALYNLPKK